MKSGSSPQVTSLSFGEHAAGTLVLPQADTARPAVILLHGFASHQDEVGGFFERLAARLALSGIASFRFTFQGFELPPGEWVDSSIESMVLETEAACTALAAHPQIDTSRIGLLGFSLGAAAAILTAARQPARFKALATWSCAADLESSFRRLIGAPLFDRAIAGEDVDIDLGWRRIRLRASFFQGLVGCHPEEAIRLYAGPFLAIAGGEDDLSEYLDLYYRNAAGAVKEKLLINGADHIFNVLDEPERFSSQVIGKTVEWFSQTL